MNEEESRFIYEETWEKHPWWLVQKQERKRGAKLLVKTKQAELHTEFSSLWIFVANFQ